MTAPKIVIIGAGPAGMALAKILQNNQITCTIYEKDADRNARDQGGSLDLHPKGGQLAVKEAGLMDDFRRLSRPESDCMKVLDYSGKVLHDDGLNTKPHRADSYDRPEIDRTLLRDMFLDSLEPGTVHWGHGVKDVQRVELSNGRVTHTLTFENGATVTDIDLLVGADGAFSKIRPLITDVTPFYAGITAITLTKSDTAKTNPWLSTQVGAGSCFMFDEGRSVQCQRQGDGSVRVYACLRKPLEWSKECGLNWSQPAAARKALVDEYYTDCGADIKRTILETDDSVESRHLWMLPVGLKWDSKPSVTLLGDAAHLQTPFAGIGVNVALVDSMECARALIKRKASLQAGGRTAYEAIAAAVKEYEKLMFPRAEESMEQSAAGLRDHFLADGAQDFARRLKARDSLRSWRSWLPF